MKTPTEKWMEEYTNSFYNRPTAPPEPKYDVFAIVAGLIAVVAFSLAGMIAMAWLMLSYFYR